jgi:hypothetical protein
VKCCVMNAKAPFPRSQIYVCENNGIECGNRWIILCENSGFEFYESSLMNMGFD